MNADLKMNIAKSAGVSLLVLLHQTNHMLDRIEAYLEVSRRKNSSKTHQIHLEQFSAMVETLGSVPTQIGDVITTWQSGQPRVLSVEGVEETLLNEMWITLEICLVFFVENGFDPLPFNQLKALQAYKELLKFNRMMK